MKLKLEDKLVDKKYNLVNLCDRFLIFSLALMIFTVPFSESIKNIAFGMTLFFWLTKISIKREFIIKMYALGWFHFAFLMVSILSALFAINVYQGFRGVWDIFRYFAVFLIIINNIDSERKIRLLVAIFLVSISIGCIWGIYESLQSPTQYLAQLRIHSLGHQNHTATYLLIMFAIALGFLINFQSSTIVKLINLYFLILIGISIILTDSRTAFVTFFVMFLAFIFVIKKWKILTIGVIVLLSSLLGLYTFSSFSKNRTFSQAVIAGYKGILSPTEDPFVQQRLRLWKKTLNIIAKNPVLGVGVRNFDLTMISKQGEGPSHAHNLFLNIGAEMGILGLMTFLSWLFCYIYTWAKSKARLVNDLDKALWLAVLGSFITIIISGLATTTLHTESAIAFTSIVGLLLSSLKIKAVKVLSL